MCLSRLKGIENPRVGGSIPSLGTTRMSDHDRHGLKSPEKSGLFLYLLSEFVFCGMAKSKSFGGIY